MSVFSVPTYLGRFQGSHPIISPLPGTLASHCCTDISSTIQRTCTYVFHDRADLDGKIVFIRVSHSLLGMYARIRLKSTQTIAHVCIHRLIFPYLIIKENEIQTSSDTNPNVHANIAYYILVLMSIHNESARPVLVTQLCIHLRQHLRILGHTINELPKAAVDRLQAIHRDACRHCHGV